MSDNIHPPIILADGRDVFVYPDTDALRRDVEPADVPAMDIVCLDSRGLRLSVTTDGSSVAVNKAESTPSGANDGIAILQQYFDLCQVEFDRRASLGQLIEVARSLMK